MKTTATFCSVWDGGVVIASSCVFDTETSDVTEVESVDVEALDLNSLDEQYVEVNGEKITEFTIDGEPVE